MKNRNTGIVYRWTLVFSRSRLARCSNIIDCNLTNDLGFYRCPFVRLIELATSYPDD